VQQVNSLHKKFDILQNKYGEKNLKAIYGAGNINNPDAMFIFMNPTSRNVSSNPEWKSIRAPWIGTKQIWSMFYSLNLLNRNLLKIIDSMKPNEWDTEFAKNVYTDIQSHNIYLTNLAKSTQKNAESISNKIFKQYLNLMFKEIEIINPKKIITFGNQVSSILLNKTVSVSNYTGNRYEILALNINYPIYPTYYPVGQGRRNMQKALQRIKKILT